MRSVEAVRRDSLDSAGVGALDDGDGVEVGVEEALKPDELGSRRAAAASSDANASAARPQRIGAR